MRRRAQDRDLTKRQYVRFAFYKLDPVWRRLAPQKQAAQKRELLETIEGFNRRMLLRPYSLMGTRSEVELLLWQIAEHIEPFQELASSIASTQMGAYLNLVQSYLSQTKRSVRSGTYPERMKSVWLFNRRRQSIYLFIPSSRRAYGTV